MKKMYRTLPANGRLPYALYKAEQVRNLDRTAIEKFSMPCEQLMANAGMAAFNWMKHYWPNLSHIAVFCGAGNNGGDGYVIARLAAEQGIDVSLYQFGNTASMSADAKSHRHKLPDSVQVVEDFDGLPVSVELVVDALLGTGLNSAVRGTWLAAIEAINKCRCPVLSVDIPSGLNADSGQIMAAAVRADVTVSFIGLKQGMFTGQARNYCGEIHFESLDVPAAVYASEILQARRVEWAKIKHLVKRRARTAHKGNFGHLLIVGGAPGFSGAIQLAGEAALRTGAGLVSLATDPFHAASLNLHRPELMVHVDDHDQHLEFLLSRASAVVFGPGSGQSDKVKLSLKRVLRSGLPLIIDADGLNLIAGDSDLIQYLGSHILLTPHPGEAARMLQMSVAEIEADRFAAVDALRRKYRTHVLLKGAGTLIIDADAVQPIAVCSDGNPGMASGGMGDVLSGICGSFSAQGYSLDESAILGCCLHAAAADLQARQKGENGLLASDLFAAIRELLNQHD